MGEVNHWTKLTEAVRVCRYGLIYQPFPDEPDPLALSFLAEMEKVVIPPDRHQRPKNIIDEVRQKISGAAACLIIPGRRFDFLGGRHGRCGGWYDRFLALAPETWLRIGLTEREAIVPELKVKSWDKPVDWLVWFDGVWRAHETGARRRV